jgi:hypothetical protein
VSFLDRRRRATADGSHPAAAACASGDELCEHHLAAERARSAARGGVRTSRTKQQTGWRGCAVPPGSDWRQVSTVKAPVVLSWCRASGVRPPACCCSHAVLTRAAGPIVLRRGVHSSHERCRLANYNGPRAPAVELPGFSPPPEHTRRRVFRGSEVPVGRCPVLIAGLLGRPACKQLH